MSNEENNVKAEGGQAAGDHIVLRGKYVNVNARVQGTSATGRHSSGEWRWFAGQSPFGARVRRLALPPRLTHPCVHSSDVHDSYLTTRHTVRDQTGEEVQFKVSKGADNRQGRWRRRRV